MEGSYVITLLPGDWLMTQGTMTFSGKVLLPIPAIAGSVSLDILVPKEGMHRER